MGKIKDNWAWVLFITILTAALSLGGQWVFRGCDRQATLSESAASIPYVDEKCKETRIYIDSQDRAAAERMDRIQLEVGKKADKDDLDKIFQQLMENSRTTQENNKLLIEVLSKINKIM